MPQDRPDRRAEVTRMQLYLFLPLCGIIALVVYQIASIVALRLQLAGQ